MEMTQKNTMPDVILVENDKSGWFPAEWDTGPDFVDQNDVTKYIRADLHTDLLKQAREAMYGARFHKTNEHVFAELNKAIRAIDKALGENKTPN